MVDETSNKIKTIWAFNPAELKEDILKTLVGRDREISDLIEWLKINKGSVPEKHRLFHGSRGIGKTTLLLAVYYTILKTPNLLKAFLPITFSEDSSLLTNEANFVKEVYDFLRQNTDKLEITEKFNEHKNKWASSLDSLIEFSHSINRTFVFLIDNFQAFLGSVLEGRGSRRGASEGPKFLKKLLSTPEFLIIACSLKRSDKIKNKKEAPYWERFEKEELPKLKDFSEASALLFKRAELEGKDFAPDFPKLSGRIRAIFALSEGNPRYLVLLYQILRKEQFENLKVDFCSILDGLTGVLDAEIERQLSAKQKPVLKALCQCGGRGTVKDVIREYFIEGFEPDEKQEKEIGNVLSSLLETDFVEVDKEARGRLKVYQITPPLFQLWYEMRHLGRSHHVILLTIFERFYKLPLEDLSTAFNTLLSDFRLRPETASARASDFLLYSHLAEKGSEHLSDLMEVTRSVSYSEQKDEYIQMVKDFQKQFQFMGNKEKTFQNRLIQSYSYYLWNRNEESEKQLKKLLEDMEGEDFPLIGASALWLLAQIVIKKNNPQSSLEICKEALSVAQRLESSQGQRLLGDIHYTQGKAYDLEGSYEQAITCFGKALEFHRISERKREQALDLEGIGVSIGNRGDHEKAVQYLQESLELWNQLPEKKNILGCLYNLSSELHYSGKLDEAVEMLKQTIDLSREIGDKGIEVYGIINLSATLINKRDYEGAIKEIEQAISLSREIRDKGTEAGALTNLSAALIYKGDYEGAIKASEQAIALSQEIGDKRIEAQSLTNLGVSLRRTGHYEQSIKELEKSIELSRKVGNKKIEALALGNLGASLVGKGDYERSIKVLEQAKELSREIGDKRAETDALRNLFWARLENTRELVISSKLGSAAQELESARDSLCGFDSPQEHILFLNDLLFIPLLSKGFYNESLSLKESVERWKIGELNDYLNIMNAVIREFLDPEKHPDSSLPPVERTATYEIVRQAKGKKTLLFAIELIFQHKYPEALEILEDLYKDTPDDLQVVRNACNAAIMAKQLSKAETYCKQAMDLSNRAPVDVGYWGIFLKEKGDIESGEKELIEAVSKGSDIVFHYGVLCDIYDKQKRFSEAADLMKKALNNLKLNYNKQADFRLDLCEYLIMENKTEETYENFEQIDFKKIALPQKTNYLFQKYLLSRIRSDQGAASIALKEFCDLLMEQGDKACSNYDFTNLIQYAVDHLGEKQITLLRRWGDAAKGLITMSEFVQIYGTEEQREKAAKEWNDERSLAIHRLKSGKIKNLDDIQKLSTGSNPIETSLDAYSYFYDDLPEELQDFSRGLIIAGLSFENPTVNKTAAQSAGAIFWKFSPEEKEKALSGLSLLAKKSDAPLDLRDAALSVIAALFFQLEPSLQDSVLPVLREVEKEYSPVYLKQLISRIDHKEEDQS
jgi:tetratricopeptide (TPR) repeat protein